MAVPKKCLCCKKESDVSNVNRVIYSSVSISSPSFKALAQKVIKISYWKEMHDERINKQMDEQSKSPSNFFEVGGIQEKTCIQPACIEILLESSLSKRYCIFIDTRWYCISWIQLIFLVTWAAFQTVDFFIISLTFSISCDMWPDINLIPHQVFLSKFCV